jgi:toluene monooxygenase system protein A
VKVQRDKDAGAYSVKAALERSRIFENADPGWKSVMKAHYGAIARGEYAAASAEARMMRFSKAPGMRNMATLGCMDEIRHGQMQLYFPTSTWPRTARWTGPSRPTTPTSGR